MNATDTYSNDPALQALLPLQDLLEEAFGLDVDEDTNAHSEPLYAEPEGPALESAAA